MKIAISNLIKFTIFISIVIVLLFKVGKIFIPENISRGFQGITYTINGFYKMPKNSIDVVFIGDSNMSRAISPMELWNEYGIAAYNYSVTSARTWTEYHFIKEILRTQKPKIVVIDPVTIFYGCATRESLAHVAFDYMPLSLTKLEMVNDPAFELSFEDKLGMILPIYRYHDRWQKITAADFSKMNEEYYSITRGYVMQSTVKPNKNGYSYMDKESENLTFKCAGDEYLLKIKELCEKNNVKLLVLGLEEAVNWGKTQSEYLESFTKENSIEYYDLNQDRYLNWDEDTKDKGMHVNILGAMKTMKKVGEYFEKHYDLPDHRGEKEYDFWNDDYKEYEKYKNIFITEANKKVNKMKNN